ncbi:MAG: sulfite exporter TauE/SafE family protein [Chloroflexi bacterium]|nr:sulfite exporter TauE/SafE family protein [Chloroflexota bacterium]
MDASLLGLAALGFLAGAYGTVIGAGGGFIIVPALLLLYPKYGPQEVTAISLAVVWANATSGSIAYARQRRIDYVTGALFAASSVPGVIGGALVVHLVPERLFAVLFGLLLLAMAGVTLSRPPTAIRPPLPGRGLLVRRVVADGMTYRYGYKVWQGVLLSLGVGFASSLFGIGGGVIHVPAMILLLHIPLQFAVATSHFILAFMSGGASLVHLVDGSLGGTQLLRAAALGVGAIPGAQLGAQISHRLKVRTVLALLVVALVVLAGRLIVKGALDL